MPIEDLHRYAELAQQGDSTAPERLRILEDHRRRIKEDIRELRTSLELVERKIAGYAELRQSAVSHPQSRRPPPRQVRIRPPS
jgi:DNA-binding transcriptional MerR regulator